MPMRFHENGPAIPDELLTARDEGRVVFFCGAGVSQPAGLPDFLGLVERVIENLRVPADDPVRKILGEARELECKTGMKGLIPADRIFGILEREFAPQLIGAEVAQALKPESGIDLSAHQILLDLATTQDGKVRLVTTNFDRLFESCNGNVEFVVWHPPNLPDPSRPNDMHGIIHLHGLVNGDYNGPEDGGFILSSAEFGRAYLAEGWATNFFKEILEKYCVVFVGYSADDPPVQYLLEALHRKTGQLSGVYAFQVGSQKEAVANWQHKGVEAIPYDDNEKHIALWETLESWAERARSPGKWIQSVIELAQEGPEKLKPHQRGQVAHVISTLEGARRFSQQETPPPAEWLCVFDPGHRYGRPGRAGYQGPQIDPFDLYGIDFDLPPKKIEPDAYSTKRDTPKDAWDGLAAGRLDRQNLSERHYSVFNGHLAIVAPQLPPRLGWIATWLGKVADQPAAVWWAASQEGLHQNIQEIIKWELTRRKDNVSPEIRNAWRYLFEAWPHKRKDFSRDWYVLKAEIGKDGWNQFTTSRLAADQRPYLEVRRNYFTGPKAPESKTDVRLTDILSLNIKYPSIDDDIVIPDEWLASITREYRKNLEYAHQLENEIGGNAFSNLCPIIPYKLPDNDGHERRHELSGQIVRFSELFSRLMDSDTKAAHEEFLTWPTNGNAIFDKLRVWVAGWKELLPATDFASIVLHLSPGFFWSVYQRHDLLLGLAKRWQDFPRESLHEIERRILEGPPKWDGEEEEEFAERRAREIVGRFTWLASEGCKSTFDLAAETAKLQQLAPGGERESIGAYIRPMVPRGGFVKTDTDYTELSGKPLKLILATAHELSGRTEDFLVERNPFAGFAAKYPVRAFATLTDAAKRNEYPEWAWKTFLRGEARKNDRPKFITLIAERICRLPEEVVTKLLYPATEWLHDTGTKLALQAPDTLEKTITKFIDSLAHNPATGDSAIIRGDKPPDWATEALNSPVGKLAQTLFQVLKAKEVKAGDPLPPVWLNHAERLLSLPGDPRRYALTMFAYFLDWFFHINPDWTETRLLSALDGGNNDDHNALWSGFLWGATPPHAKLYTRIKPNLLALAKECNLPERGQGEVLASVLLAGWGQVDKETNKRLVSNQEMHDVLLRTNDEFRQRLLWQLERWAKFEDEETGKIWQARLPELLRDVWPRQKSANTPATSAQLCTILFSNSERFAELSAIVLPLLTKGKISHLLLPNIDKDGSTIIDNYPAQSLAVLHAVLLDDIADWPYGIDEALQRIVAADESLKHDPRWLELMRKWNSR